MLRGGLVLNTMRNVLLFLALALAACSGAPAEVSPIPPAGKLILEVGRNGNVVALSDGSEVILPSENTADWPRQSCSNVGTGPYTRTTSVTGTVQQPLNYMSVRVRLPLPEQVQNLESEAQRLRQAHAWQLDDPQTPQERKDAIVQAIRNLRQAAYVYVGGLGNRSDRIDAGFVYEAVGIAPSGHIRPKPRHWKLFVQAQQYAAHSVLFEAGKEYTLEFWAMNDQVFVSAVDETGRLATLAYRFSQGPTDTRYNWRANGVGNSFKKVVSIAQINVANVPTALSYQRFFGPSRLEGVELSQARLGFIDEVAYVPGNDQREKPMAEWATGPREVYGSYAGSINSQAWSSDVGCSFPSGLVERSQQEGKTAVAIRLRPAPSMSLSQNQVVLRPSLQQPEAHQEVLLSNQGVLPLRYQMALPQPLPEWLQLQAPVSGTLEPGQSQSIALQGRCPQNPQPRYVTRVRWSNPYLEDAIPYDLPFSGRNEWLQQYTEIQLECSPQLSLNLSKASLVAPEGTSDQARLVLYNQGLGQATFSLQALWSSNSPPYVFRALAALQIDGPLQPEAKPVTLYSLASGERVEVPLRLNCAQHRGRGGFVGAVQFTAQMGLQAQQVQLGLACLDSETVSGRNQNLRIPNTTGFWCQLSNEGWRLRSKRVFATSIPSFTSLDGCLQGFRQGNYSGVTWPNATLQVNPMDPSMHFIQIPLAP